MELRKPQSGMPTLLPEGHTRADGLLGKGLTYGARLPYA